MSRIQIEVSEDQGVELPRAYVPPSEADAAVHKKCIVRTVELTDIVRTDWSAIVRLLKVDTEAELARCWASPAAPAGTPTFVAARFYTAKLIIAQFGNGEVWIQGGKYLDLHTKLLQGLRGQWPKVRFESIRKVFPDGNRSHWILVKKGVAGAEVMTFVERNAALLIDKHGQARDEADGETPYTAGPEHTIGDVLVRTHNVGKDQDIIAFRCHRRTAGVLVLHEGKLACTQRWVRFHPSVEGAERLLDLLLKAEEEKNTALSITVDPEADKAFWELTAGDAQGELELWCPESGTNILLSEILALVEKAKLTLVGPLTQG